MPRSALNNLDVDYCLPLPEMGAVLGQLVNEAAGPHKPIPEDIKIEASIAERGLSDVEQVSGLGAQVPYNCPNHKPKTSELISSS
jgi:two-component system, chemotaxis family, protein-glutamate methylesterase/glutaminase